MKGTMAQAIVRDPKIMRGTPVFRGTRVPAQTLFEYFEGGETLADFLEGFPTVSRELALQALEEARQLLLRGPELQLLDAIHFAEVAVKGAQRKMPRLASQFEHHAIGKAERRF